MKCWTRDCKNEAVKGCRYCYACTKRKYREKYPIKYAYDTIKANAKRRGKSFLLTYKEFEKFCKDSGYHKLKGITPDALSVDRVDNLKGYSVDNIKAITLKDNTIKRNTIDTFPEELTPQINAVVPF
jgi:hypothetical protein